MDKTKIKKTSSEVIKTIKKDLNEGNIDSWTEHVTELTEWAGSGSLTIDKMAKMMANMMEPFEVYAPGVKQVKKKVPKKAKATSSVGIGLKKLDMKLYPLPPKKKEGEKIERIFKMSDFKFPPVKRVNTRLARKTLQTDLGTDILEDIGGLKI